MDLYSAVAEGIGRMKSVAGTAEGGVAELAALYRLTDRLYRAQSLDDAYAAALEAIVATLGCSRASILLFDAEKVMRFVAWHGLSDNYRKTLEGHSPWTAGERDPQPIFVPDIADTSEPQWIKDTIVAEGIRGLAFIPIVAQGATIGKFMTYYESPHAFSPHEIELAVTIARQVGFSIERARAESARRLAEDEMRESEERFRLMSEHAPVMIWMSDANGACLHLNRMQREFWNVGEDEIAKFDWRPTMHPDDAQRITEAMIGAIRTRTPVSIKGRYRDSLGRYRILETDARPRFSSKGEFLGMIGVNQDITDRESAEASLRDSEERFRLAVEAAPSGMIMTDGEGRIVMLNANAEKLFGYARDELLGRHVEVLVPERFRKSHPGYRAVYRDHPLMRAMGAGRDLFALRKDGSEIPVEIGLNPIEAAGTTMAIAAVVDISERKRAEAQRELLVAELNHRVKNTLAVVQGVAHQTFRDIDPQVRKAFEGRLVALATAHNLLTRSNWESASLQTLATDTLHSQSQHNERVTLSGPPVLLPPQPALAITMALHELFTNAIKYGALSNETGNIAFAWRRKDGDQSRLQLIWREQGGPLVSAPKRRGFGSLLLEQTLAQDLNGEVIIEFQPEGLVCTIEASLPLGARHG